MAAGLVLGGVSRVFGKLERPSRNALPSLLLVSLLTVACSYGPIFWGAARIDSGLSAVVNLALIPISLILAEIGLEGRHPTVRQILACVVGLPGLALLFLGGGAVEPSRLEGILAVVVGTFSYGTGSVLSRRIPSRPSPITVSSVCNVCGAVLLGLGAIATQELQQFQWDNLTPTVLGAWVFLVGFGTIFGFTVYLHLLRVWGAGRAGMYAFLSPIVAVIAGAIALNERLTLLDGAGMALMITGAVIALWPTRPSKGQV
jgi:drug/metabolite transporter (DMT)-like permease